MRYFKSIALASLTGLMSLPLGGVSYGELSIRTAQGTISFPSNGRRVQVTPNRATHQSRQHSGQVYRQEGNYGGSYQNRAGTSGYGHVTPHSAYGGYRSARGSRGSGYVNRYGAGGQYRSSNGTAGGGYVNRYGAGGYYRNPNGTQVSGYASRDQGRFQYRDRYGRQYGGGYRADGRGNGSVNGQYANRSGNYYAGSVRRQGNRTQLSGEYRRPSTALPGMQERYYGRVDMNGRRSNVGVGGALYDATGRYRIGSSSTNLSGRGVTRSQHASVGGVSSRQSETVRFQGLNSSYGKRQSVSTGGVTAQRNYHVSRQGASGGASVRVGGQKLGVSGSVSSKGGSISLGGKSLSW